MDRGVGPRDGGNIGRYRLWVREGIKHSVHHVKSEVILTHPRSHVNRQLDLGIGNSWRR